MPCRRHIYAVNLRSTINLLLEGLKCEKVTIKELECRLNQIGEEK
jgi:hypothetical protein